MLCKSSLPALESSAAVRNCLDHDVHLRCQALRVNDASDRLISGKFVNASVAGELGPGLSWNKINIPTHVARNSTGVASNELT